MRALLGDMGAFDELVRRFRDAVLLIARHELGGGAAAAAEDVAQDVFLLAFKALPQLKEPSRFGGWLCAITRNRARRLGAREGRCQATERGDLDRLILAASRELAPHPLDIALREFERRQLLAALAQLPDDHRVVLHLRYFDEWPVARIAGFLSLPVTTVKWRLHQGRALLRRRLTTTALEGTEDGTERRKRG